MKVLLDFSLSESRQQLDKTLLEMKKGLEFELHNSLAEYERQLKLETGDTYCVLDAESIVNNTVGQITNNIRNVLSQPLPVMLASWDDGADVLDLIRESFEKGSQQIENMALGDTTEVYLSMPMKDGSNMFEMVELSKVLETANSKNIEELLSATSLKVKDICIKEMVYIQTKLDKGVSW